MYRAASLLVLFFATTDVAAQCDPVYPQTYPVYPQTYRPSAIRSVPVYRPTPSAVEEPNKAVKLGPPAVAEYRDGVRVWDSTMKGGQKQPPVSDDNNKPPVPKTGEDDTVKEIRKSLDECRAIIATLQADLRKKEEPPVKKEPPPVKKEPPPVKKEEPPKHIMPRVKEDIIPAEAPPEKESKHIMPRVKEEIIPAEAPAGILKRPSQIKDEEPARTKDFPRYERDRK